MVDHEYPYLEKPAILEYPTETWAAQDMRKADVFLLAAGHASGDERRRFLQGAARFFEYSVRTLHEMPTRTLTRPLVLMLSNGYLYLSPDAAGNVDVARGGRGAGGAANRATFYAAKPRSNSVKSESVNRSDSAEAFCRTCSGEPDSGMEMTCPLRIVQARATAAG